MKRDYDASVDFQALKTYAWRQRTAQEMDPSANPLADARVRGAADAALSAKGYRKVVQEKADFLVASYYSVEKEYESDQVRTGVGVGTGLGRGGFGGISIGVGSGDREREQETLTLDILDPSGKLLWRGFTRRTLVRRSDPRKADADMKKVVDAILSKFPPKPA